MPNIKEIYKKFEKAGMPGDNSTVAEDFGDYLLEHYELVERKPEVYEKKGAIRDLEGNELPWGKPGKYLTRVELPELPEEIDLNQHHQEGVITLLVLVYLNKIIRYLKAKEQNENY